MWDFEVQAFSGSMIELVPDVFDLLLGEVFERLSFGVTVDRFSRQAGSKRVQSYAANRRRRLSGENATRHCLAVDRSVIWSRNASTTAGLSNATIDHTKAQGALRYVIGRFDLGTGDDLGGLTISDDGGLELLDKFFCNRATVPCSASICCFILAISSTKGRAASASRIGGRSKHGKYNRI